MNRWSCCTFSRLTLTIVRDWADRTKINGRFGSWTWLKQMTSSTSKTRSNFNEDVNDFEMNDRIIRPFLKRCSTLISMKSRQLLKSENNYRKTSLPSRSTKSVHYQEMLLFFYNLTWTILEWIACFSSTISSSTDSRNGPDSGRPFSYYIDLFRMTIWIQCILTLISETPTVSRKTLSTKSINITYSVLFSLMNLIFSFSVRWCRDFIALPDVWTMWKNNE